MPLAILAGAFLVRVFIIFHDCGHGSFFKSRKANDILGFITGVLTFTPYHHWRWEHAAHHATSGDLDRRGMGDIWTLTVQEYLESSRWKRFAYRLARNPVVLFVLAPLFLFLVKHRFPKARASRRERHSVYWTNLAILGMAAGLSWVFGLKAYLLIQLIVLVVAGSAGFWLFYVQHQFEGVYWERGDEWDYTTAALQGSSFYKLPEDAAMVLRQHRVSSHSSSEPADSQLQPGEMPQSGSAVSEREAGHPVLQLEIIHLPSLG